jgi:hypothetical protein
MYNEPFINSSWLLDVIRYPFYQATGLVGHSILGGLVVAATFGIIAIAYRFSLWQSVILFPILSYALYPVNFHSFRGQTLSSLFLIILLYILKRYDEFSSSKPTTHAPQHTTINHQPATINHILTTYHLQPTTFFYFLPIFFILWTNLNGQFLLGLAFLGLWTGIRIPESIVKKIRIQFSHSGNPAVGGSTQNQSYLNTDSGVLSRQSGIVPRMTMRSIILIFILSLLATFINPYTYHLYTDEVFLHSQSPAMQYISEWLPITPASGLTWYIMLGWGLLLIISVIVLISRKKLLNSLPFLLFGLLLFFASLQMGRYVWSMFTVTSPFLGLLIGLIEPKNKKLQVIIISGLLLVMSYFLLFIEMPSHKLDKNTWDTYCSFTACSPGAAKYVIEHDTGKKIWTDYNLGGWLIWNYPEIKPVIDGRMPLWEDAKKRYSPFLDNYYPLEQGISDPDESSYDVFMVKNNRGVLQRFVSLTKIGKWKVGYRDYNITVFERNPISL